jgi:hypothetical protein
LNGLSFVGGRDVDATTALLVGALDVVGLATSLEAVAEGTGSTPGPSTEVAVALGALTSTTGDVVRTTGAAVVARRGAFTNVVSQAPTAKANAPMAASVMTETTALRIAFSG